MSRYIGLTIGPIYPTLKQARSTRELWGASYLFSSIFGKIAANLKSHVIIPYVNESINSPIGLYPDRIILKCNDAQGRVITIGDIHRVIREIFSEIARDYIKVTKSSHLQIAIDQFQKSIRIHAYEVEISDGQNTVLQLYSQLDNMELFNQLPSNEAIISQYFKHINESQLYSDAGWTTGRKFPMLFDISAYSLAIKHPIKFEAFTKAYFHEQNKIEKFAGSNSKQAPGSITRDCQVAFGEDFKPYHKYFALVHADGDNTGSVVSKLGHDERKIHDFSKVLFEYGKEAGEIISNYGGLPVYIGGDDLLFFAPLANDRVDGASNILELIKQLDDSFSSKYLPEILKLLDDRSVIPSFSYGVSVNFVKYPLKESLEYSYRNLQKAKSDTYKSKNSVVITLQKHSGQQIETGFEKSDSFYSNHLLDFISKHCFKVYTADYNSFRRKSAEYHPFLKYLPSYHGSVENFLTKNFDHDFSKGYWKILKDILVVAYSDPAEADKRIEMLNFAIRFIHFINSDTDD